MLTRPNEVVITLFVSSLADFIHSLVREIGLLQHLPLTDTTLP